MNETIATVLFLSMIGVPVVSPLDHITKALNKYKSIFEKSRLNSII